MIADVLEGLCFPPWDRQRISGAAASSPVGWEDGSTYPPPAPPATRPRKRAPCLLFRPVPDATESRPWRTADARES